MKKLYLILCLLLFCVSAFGQTASQNARRVISGTGVPNANCIPGPPWTSVYIRTTDHSEYHCTAAPNVWTKVASGSAGAGTVTSVTGTTNQINVATGTTTPALTLSSTIIAPGTVTATTSVASPFYVSTAADPADAGAIRLGNTEVFGWEVATPGTDKTLGVNASDQLASTADILAPNYFSSSQTYYINTTGTVFWKAGPGSPEGAVTGGIGSFWSQTDGTTNTATWRKETGTGNTGWVAIAGLPLTGGTLTGGLGFSATNTLDIGTSATVLAPRTVYAGTSVVSPVLTATTSSSLGVASATSVNKWAFTAPTTAATLVAGGDSLTYTFPASSATLARVDAGNAFIGTQTISDGTRTLSFSPNFTSSIPGFGTSTGHGLYLNTNGIRQFYFDTAGSVAMNSGATFKWSSSTVGTGTTTDTTISRNAAGVVQIGTTAANALGELNFLNGIVGGTLSVTGASTFTGGARINPREATVASSATPTPNSDTTDIYTVTALAEAATFGAPTGTPVQGQKLMVRVKDNATARALAFNAIYRASSDLALPTTTVLSKTMYLLFVYNSTDTKWDFLSFLNNF